MIHFLDIAVDTSKRSVYKSGKIIQTSSLNFNMLVYFLENPNKVISKEELKEKVWNGRVVSDNTVYKQLKRLKEELLILLSDEELLKTVHGRGVVFAAEIKTTDKEAEFSGDITESKPISIKQSLSLRLLLLLMFLILIFDFFQINSIKQKNVKLTQKVERLAIVYRTDTTQNTAINQQAVAQALGSQMLISDQLNVALEKASFDGETFKQISTNLRQDLGYDHVINMQIVGHEHGVKALVFLRKRDYMFPLKIFEVSGTYELVNQVSRWVLEQLQTGESYAIADMTDSESAFDDYLTALRLEIENKPDLARELFQQVVEKDPEFYQAWIRLASQYRKRGQVEKAFEALEKINLSDASDRLSFQVLSMRAGCYFHLGNLSLASSIQQQAMTYAEKIHDPMIQVVVLVNQSYVYSAMFLFDKARKNLEKALLYVDKKYQKSALANIYTGLFDAYNKNYDITNALHYAELAYQGAQSADNQRLINLALSNLAGALLMSAEFDKAYNKAQKVVDFSDVNEFEPMLDSLALATMVRIDLEYGRFNTARIKLDAWQNKLENIENPPLLIEYLNSEYSYHMGMGNWSKAADFLEKSRVLTQKVEYLNVKIDFAMLQVDYELRIEQANISIEQLEGFDETMPNSPHLYAKAQIWAYNNQLKKAEIQFEQSMLVYQKLGQNYTLIHAINAYLGFMLDQKTPSESVNNWLIKLEALSPPPYPYLKNKALYQSLTGDNNSAAITMQQLKKTANQLWTAEDDRLLLQYSKSLKNLSE
ncbi:hypothetical protein MNBD_GAMMA01-67 [hydrothermal vent metagenome]|uniref:OmpR/PhoB-type domain-containing protein n=2 Tax=hydrothermal vent metagenome TaxID=652676 RepID=A0A3B0VHI4_9ZZZZ